MSSSILSFFDRGASRSQLLSLSRPRTLCHRPECSSSLPGCLQQGYQLNPISLSIEPPNSTYHCHTPCAETNQGLPVRKLLLMAWSRIANGVGDRMIIRGAYVLCLCRQVILVHIRTAPGLFSTEATLSLLSAWPLQSSGQVTGVGKRIACDVVRSSGAVVTTQNQDKCRALKRGSYRCDPFVPSTCSKRHLSSLRKQFIRLQTGVRERLQS